MKPLSQSLTSNCPGNEWIERWISGAANDTPEGARVLDAGCGSAPFSAKFKNQQYESLDVRPSADHVPTYVCALESIPVESDYFDVIVCTQVLEHVYDPLAVLIELQRVLKPDGKLFLSAPLLFEEHEMPNDYFRFTQSGFQTLAERSGFQIQVLQRVEGFYASSSYLLGLILKHLQYSELRQKMNYLTYVRTAIKFRVFKWILQYWHRYLARLEYIHRDENNGYPLNFALELTKRPSGDS